MTSSNRTRILGLSLFLGILVIPAEGLARIEATPLIVVVEGVRFQVEAAAFRMSRGWGVTITLKASSDDGHIHGINDPPVRTASRWSSGLVTMSSSSAGSFCPGPEMAWPYTIVPGRERIFRESFPYDRSEPTSAPAVGFGEQLEIVVGIYCLETSSDEQASPDLATVRIEVSESRDTTIEILPAVEWLHKY